MPAILIFNLMLMSAPAPPVDNAPPPDVAEALKLLETGSLPEKKQALKILMDSGRAGRVAVPRAKRLLSDPALRTRAALYLARFAPDTNGVVSALQEAVRSADKDDHLTGAVGLLQLGSRAAPAVNDLVNLLGEPQEVGASASEALGRIGKPAIPSLVPKLADTNPDVRRTALHALAVIGPDAKESETFLIDRLLNDGDRNVREEAARAVASVAPASEKALRPLLKALTDVANEPRDVGDQIAAALATYGTPIIPELLQILSDIYTPGRESAVRALARIGLTAAPVLISELSSSNAARAAAARVALSEMGDKAVPFLLDALDSKDQSTRWQSALALAMTRPPRRECLSTLLDMAKTGNADQRRTAITVLGQVASPQDKDALDFLKQTNDDPNLRQLAEHALERINYRAQRGLP